MTNLSTHRPALQPVSSEEMLAVEGGGILRSLCEIAAVIIRAVLRPGSPTT
jgi:hypothetical protein